MLGVQVDRRELLGRLEHALRGAAAMMPEAGAMPLVIQPNAGLPSRIGERLMYLSSPQYMADYAGAHDRGGRAAPGRLLRHDARSTSPRCAR